MLKTPPPSICDRFFVIVQFVIVAPPRSWHETPPPRYHAWFPVITQFRIVGRLDSQLIPPPNAPPAIPGAA